MTRPGPSAISSVVPISMPPIARTLLPDAHSGHRHPSRASLGERERVAGIMTGAAVEAAYSAWDTRLTERGNRYLTPVALSAMYDLRSTRAWSSRVDFPTNGRCCSL